MNRILLALSLAVAAAAVVAGQTVDQKAWQRWLADVRPLLQADEAILAKSLAPPDRGAFQESFWLRRNPNPAAPGNANRRQLETRIKSADDRFRDNGRAWNDCGTVFLVLGPPDRMENVVGDRHFSTNDQARQFVDQDGQVAEMWTYRNSPRLPASPNNYVFRFDPSCRFVGSPQSERLVTAAAVTYLPRER